MKRIAFCLAFAAFALPALAQQGHQGHGARPSANEPASTREFRAANDKMHRDMNIRFTGDADRDFAAGMIPHHQGAIDMARVVLRHGKEVEEGTVDGVLQAPTQDYTARLVAVRGAAASDKTRAAAVFRFFDWAFRDGDAIATELEYIPLPGAVKDAVRKAWGQVKDADGKPVPAG